MGRILQQKQIDAVLHLGAEARFEYFVNFVVDTERCFGLWSEGWALMANDEGLSVFPLWPAREYADLCLIGEWEQYEPKEIALEELLDALIPSLVGRKVLPGVFPTPSGKGPTPSPGELAAALRAELEKYE